MPTYTRFGLADSLFIAYSGKPLAQTKISHTAKEIGLLNADGSETFIHGTGFVWNAATGKFTAGTVTSIEHFSDEKFTDKIVGLNAGISGLQAALEAVDSQPMNFYDFLLAGNDVLDATNRAGNAVAPVTLRGMAGNDRILGGAGSDLLIGGGDNDTVSGGGGKDSLFGENGNDALSGNGGNDILQSGYGIDRLFGGAGSDTFHGGDGNDTVDGGAGVDISVHHSDWAQMTVRRAGEGFTVASYSGRDTIVNVEQIAADTGIYRWSAADKSWERVSATPGEAVLNPGSRLLGTNGANNIDLEGKDKTVVQALDGNDTVHCAGGFDLVLGGAGSDKIYGDINEIGNQTKSIDRLYGETGNDALWGFRGDDRLAGGDGNDHLYGGYGYDALNGGAGADVFHFRWSTVRATRETWGRDVINDFDVGKDHLALHFGKFSQPKSPAELEPELTQTGNGLVISLDGAGTILLKGVNGNGLTLDDLLI